MLAKESETSGPAQRGRRLAEVRRSRQASRGVTGSWILAHCAKYEHIVRVQGASTSVRTRSHDPDTDGNEHPGSKKLIKGAGDQTLRVQRQDSGEREGAGRG